MTKSTANSTFPNSRLRRNRRTPALRAMVTENHITASDIIWPLFVCEGENTTSDIESLPGVKRQSIDHIIKSASWAWDNGIPAIALFPYNNPDSKTDCGRYAWDNDNLMNRTIRTVKQAVPDICIISDVALDPYTTHGQDGVVMDGYVANDETVDALVKQSIAQATAGADIIAPSDMMDGRVGAIRTALDKAGFKNVAIMSYAAKYASCYYGPFREAVGASLQGDKKTYQLNPANRDEAMREIAQDIAEGADSIIVKPGMPYLDIIRDASTQFNIPIVAYQVSGEYASIMAATQNGWLDKDQCIWESMIAFKRAGADCIFTYFAPEIIRILNEQ